MLDSGANTCVLGKNFHKTFTKSFPIQNTYVNATTADGSSLKVLGTITMPVHYDGTKKTLDFLIIPSVDKNIILGMNFLYSFKLLNLFALKNNLSSQLSSGINSSDTNISEVQAIVPRHKLAPHHSRQINKIIEKFREISHEQVGLGKTNLIKHKIRTEGPPIKQRYYPLSPIKLKALNDEVDRMLELGVIAPSRSPWANPVVMATKKDGSLRFCLDARKLNDVTIKDSYPIPYISSILDNLKGARYLTSLDLSSAYWQIPLEENDHSSSDNELDNSSSCQKTAFIVPGRGLFEFRRMPFGISNAGAEMQRLVDNLLLHQFGDKVFAYLDDLLIATETFEEHIEILNKVFEALKQAGLTIKLEKCKFCREELKYLGYVINEKGLKTDPDKLKSIENFPLPSTAKQLRGFIGLCSYYRRFVKHFSSIIAPMTSMLGKRKGKDGITWSEEALLAFNQLKKALTTAPVLASPDYTKRFTIHCDASSVGIGSTITQEIDGIEHPIAFFSRLLSKNERLFSTTERELLSVVDSINHFRPYIEGSKFTVITDHMSLKWLKSLNNPSGRLARWAMQISQFNFDICHRKGTLNVVPDALSRAAVSLISYAGGTENTKDNWYIKIYDGCLKHPQNFKNYFIENNILYRYSKPVHKLDKTNWKIVLPREQVQNCIKEGHDNLESIHPGIYKTYHKLRKYYYWKDMHQDIKNYIKTCETCKAYKHSNTQPHGLMKNQKIVKYPMHTLSIDLIGPLTKSYSGHIHILSVVDIFTKYCWLHPLRTATTKTVTTFLENEIILKSGTPYVVICDNAKIFKSKEFTKFCENFNIPRIFYNAYYSPQSNTVERYNQTVLTCLSILVEQDQRTWSKHLPRIQLALNSSINVATGYTPHFLATGRDIIIDGNLHKFHSTLPSQLDDLQIADRTDSAVALNELSNIFNNVQSALTEAYKRNATRYNLRRKHVVCQPNDIVWRRNFVQSNATNFFSAKLAPRFVKCRVLEKLSDLVYILQDLNTKTQGKYHIKDIIKFS